MNDLDRRCENQARELETRIARLDRIISGLRGHAALRAGLKLQRDGLLVEVHEMRKAHRAYDERLAEAMDDATGQDLDHFQFSE